MVFWQLTVDAHDPSRLARFWAPVLGYEPVPPPGQATWWVHYRAGFDPAEPTDRLFDPEGLRPPIWFQRVPEDKAGKNRLHLDVYATGRDDTLPVERRVELVEARVAEVVGLGATVLRRDRDDDPADPDYHVVLQDPEGNEFCIG